MEIAFYVLVFGGAALMVYNIVRYFMFVKTMSTVDNYAHSRGLLYFGGGLLIAFLIGYILVGIFGNNQDLVVAFILFGGSVFVFLLLHILFSIVRRLRSQMGQIESHYGQTEREIAELSATALAYFRVNLSKNLVLAVGGSDLYDTDQVGVSYETLLNARSPRMVSRFHSVGGSSLKRKDLLEAFAHGQETVSEIVLARRDERPAAFVSFKVTMVEEPGSGDVIGFFIEEDYNEKMILDTILNRAMSFRYDIVCSIIEGRYHLIATGQQDHAKAILPEIDLGTYEEFCRDHVYPLLPEDADKDEVMRRLDLQEVGKALQNSTSYETDVSILYQGQTYYKRFTFYNVTHDAQFFVLLIHDTTAIHHERALQNKRLSEALEEARKASAAKTTFFSNMSHDIRTPMNAIVGFTNLAKKSSDVDKIHEYLGKIGRSSDHLLSLINDVLELSRIESGKSELEPKETNLCDLLYDIRDLFINQMEEKGIDFTVTGEPIVHHYAYVDAFRLNRVLLNLISNAYKFTASGGKVSVAINESASENEGHGLYHIAVSDTGIGMSKEFAAHVFEAYEREKKSTINEIQGTGLGMAITKSIVDLMGGTIEVDSKEGEGTSFHISLELPIIEKKEEDSDCHSTLAAKEEEAIRHFEGKRILLADDNEINREIAEILLEEMGFAVEQASNGKEAYDLYFAKPAGYFDAILMDVQMPIMDGLEAARAIRSHPDERYNKVPIIAFTANAFEEDIELTRRAGMDDHLSKPVSQLEMQRVFGAIFE